MRDTANGNSFDWYISIIRFCFLAIVLVVESDEERNEKKRALEQKFKGSRTKGNTAEFMVKETEIGEV